MADGGTAGGRDAVWVEEVAMRLDGTGIVEVTVPEVGRSVADKVGSVESDTVAVDSREDMMADRVGDADPERVADWAEDVEVDGNDTVYVVILVSVPPPLNEVVLERVAALSSAVSEVVVD